MPLFLIGYMCSGKSTLGKALSRIPGFRFIDLDDRIENVAGRSIPEIFASSGEDGFRKLERKVLLDLISECATSGGNDADGLSASLQTVIACGGGTPCFFDNMDMLLRSGTVVWLDAPEDLLVDRLELYKSGRPLVAGKSREEIRQTVTTALSRRRPFYCRAHICFDASRLDSAPDIECSVKEFLEITGGINR